MELSAKTRIFAAEKKGKQMISIANPIYDVVFKYLMEDERIARTILSALLQQAYAKEPFHQLGCCVGFFRVFNSRKRQPCQVLRWNHIEMVQRQFYILLYFVHSNAYYRSICCFSASG